MSDSENDPLSSLLSSFALGPAWARAAGAQSDRAATPESKSQGHPSRDDDRGRSERKGGPRERDNRQEREGERRFQNRGKKFEDRRSGPPRDVEAPPAEGVRVTLNPDPEAVHLIGKEIHQVARVYPLYDVAKILLSERGRCRAVFEVHESHPPLFCGKLEPSIFLTREEALRHLWQSELRARFIEEETIEVDPPTGNFQLVARCGISGEWLGPPNHHSYQVNLRRLHREQFSSTPFPFYSSMVRVERGEEAVNAWLETMKKKTRWHIKGDAEDAWIEDQNEAERQLGARCFDQAFEESRHVDVLASIPPKNLSPSLLTSLKIAGNHARSHPAILIPAVCRAVEAEHLPVFKRMGKLFTGPARPHPLPLNAVLAVRPGIMVSWIRANKPAKLEGLWKAILPEGGSAPSADFAADLFWLLQQGHILLFTDDTLVVQDVREAPGQEPNAEGKAAKRKKKKPDKAKVAKPGAPEAQVPTEASSAESVEENEDESDDSADEDFATCETTDEGPLEYYSRDEDDLKDSPPAPEATTEPVAVAEVAMEPSTPQEPETHEPVVEPAVESATPQESVSKEPASEPVVESSTLPETENTMADGHKVKGRRVLI